MIGSEQYAEAISAIDWSTRENEDGEIRLDSIGDVPEGWEYVGSGAYRHCFRGPCGNVYKVLTSFAHRHSINNNENSYHNGLRLAQCGARLAAFDYFTDSNVMVQEYVDGEILDDETEEWVAVSAIVDGWSTTAGRFIDFHYNNFRMVNGEPVLIDW